jgi:hypothetical protein
VAHLWLRAARAISRAISHSVARLRAASLAQDARHKTSYETLLRLDASFLQIHGQGIAKGHVSNVTELRCGPNDSGGKEGIEAEIAEQRPQ